MLGMAFVSQAASAGSVVQSGARAIEQQAAKQRFLAHLIHQRDIPSGISDADTAFVGDFSSRRRA
jgi:hypothetical protein